MLDIKNFSFSYPETDVCALKNINFTVNDGEFLLICGNSGCGKTTLMKNLKPAIRPYGTASGEILINGDALDDKTDGGKIGFVMQSPDRQIVTDKVWHELAFGLENAGLEKSEIKKRIDFVTDYFSTEDLYYKNISELSGGQKQLLCLQSVMAMKPDVLILDEPTSQLDRKTATAFFGILKRINTELGTTVIISEHRLCDVLPLADKVAVMDNGEILSFGTVGETGEFLKKTGHILIDAMPVQMRLWSSVETPLECPVTESDGKKFLSEFVRNKEINEIGTDKDIQIKKVSVEVSDAEFKYSDSCEILKGFNLKAYGGEIFCIVGDNGCGKTTALKVISGIKKPNKGKVKINGRVCLLPQDVGTVFLKSTVYDDLKDLILANGITENADELIKKCATLCGIEHLIYAHPFDLSEGERQRAALCKLLILSPDVLLLDEPTKGLDIALKKQLASILEDLKRKGICIIIVSHDVDFCAKYADRCGKMSDGKLDCISSPHEFFSHGEYRTYANKIADGIIPNAVTAEDVITAIGGKICDNDVYKTEKAPIRKKYEHEKPESNRIRKVLSYITAAVSVFLLAYAVKTTDIISQVSAHGVTDEGIRQLFVYALAVAFMIITALLSGERNKNLTKRKTTLSKRTYISSAVSLLLVPVTLYLGIKFVGQKQYYITALAVLIECMLPFFFVLEGKRAKARELVIIATLCALAVAGRAAFYMIPQFKPVLAVTVIAGVSFGAESGFLVGAVSMLVSNVMFSQGPWTPWQMFAMGMAGFIAGLIFKVGILKKTRIALAVFGALAAIIIYGGITNPVAVLIWGSQSINLKMILSYYVTGFPFDAVHAFSTALFLWFGGMPILSKLDRVKTKYGLDI